MPVNATSTGASYGRSSDPLCPLGFHPQVRWPTRCKRCFRAISEHDDARDRHQYLSNTTETATKATLTRSQSLDVASSVENEGHIGTSMELGLGTPRISRSRPASTTLSRSLAQKESNNKESFNEMKESKNNLLGARLKTSHNTSNRSNNNNNTSTITFAQLESLNAELRSENLQLASHLASLENELSDKFREEPDALDNAYRNVKKELENASKTIHVLQFKLKKAEKQMTDLEAENNKLKNNAQNSDNNGSQHQNLQVFKSGPCLSRTGSTEQSDPHQLLKDLQERETDLREQLQLMEERNSVLERRVRNVEDENETLMKQLKKMANNKNSNKNDNKEDNEDIRLQLELALEEAKLLRKKIEELEKEREQNARREMEESIDKSSIRELESALQVSQSDLKVSKERIELLERQKKQLETNLRSNTRNEELFRLRSESERSKVAMVNQEERVKELETKWGKSKRINQQRKERIVQLEKQIEELKSKKEENNDKNRTKSSLNNEMSDELWETRLSLSEKMSELIALRAEKSAQMAEMQAKVNRAEEKMALLQDNNDRNSNNRAQWSRLESSWSRERDESVNIITDLRTVAKDLRNTLMETQKERRNEHADAKRRVEALKTTLAEERQNRQTLQNDLANLKESQARLKAERDRVFKRDSNNNVKFGGIEVQRVLRDVRSLASDLHNRGISDLASRLENTQADLERVASHRENSVESEHSQRTHRSLTRGVLLKSGSLQSDDVLWLGNSLDSRNASQESLASSTASSIPMPIRTSNPAAIRRLERKRDTSEDRLSTRSECIDVSNPRGGRNKRGLIGKLRQLTNRSQMMGGSSGNIHV